MGKEEGVVENKYVGVWLCSWSKIWKLSEGSGASSALLVLALFLGSPTWNHGSFRIGLCVCGGFGRLIKSGLMQKGNQHVQGSIKLHWYRPLVTWKELSCRAHRCWPRHNCCLSWGLGNPVWGHYKQGNQGHTTSTSCFPCRKSTSALKRIWLSQCKESQRSYL